MDRKQTQPKRAPNSPGRGEKEQQNPTSDKIESWLLKMPPSLVEDEGQRSVPEKNSTPGTATSTVPETEGEFASLVTGVIAGKSRAAKEKKKREIAKEKRQKMKERNEENKEDETGEKRRERRPTSKGKNEESKKGKTSENPKEKHRKSKGKNEEGNKVKTEETILRETVDTFVEIDQYFGKKGQTPLRNKVDKVTLHRKLKEYKAAQATMLSSSRQSKMTPNMRSHIENQKVKKSVGLDSNAQGWRNSWDNLMSDHFAEKERKNAEKMRKEEENKLTDVEPEVDPDVITEPIIKKQKDHLKDDIFGFRSLLNEQTRIIYRAYSTSATKESETETKESGGPDMSWVRRLSASDKKSKRKSILRHRVGRKGPRNPLYIIWVYLILGARMPFIFVRNPDPSIGFVSCKFDRRRRYYYAFLVTSVLLFLLTVITLISFFDIFFEDENQDFPHIQIEKLLLDKNWVAGIVFVTTLIMATISSFHVLKNGEAMAEYMTHWEESLNELNFNATTGIRLLTIIFIVWTTAQAIGEAILFHNKRLELNPFIEGVHLMILLVFRYFDRKILLSEYRDYYGAVVIGINNYALYCSRSFILLVMVFSVGMTNIANEWNFRLRLILNYVTPREHEASIRDLLQNLNYRKMFDEHQRIAKLVKDTSTVFGTLLLAFYFTQGIDLGGQLVEIAVYAVGLQSMEKSGFNLTAHIVNYKYEKDFYNRVDVFFRLSQTVAVVVIVSVYLAATGEAMMDALYLITRHTHMNIVSTHQRDFMMSLTMSFNPKQPYLLGSGGILDVDKPFMYSYFAVAVFFLSVMMQTRIPRLLSVPIVFECSPGSGTLCNGVRQFRPQDPDSIYNVSLPTFTTTMESSTTDTTTTTAMTTTPRPPRFPCAGKDMHPTQLFKCKGAEVDRFRVYDENGFDKSDRLNNSLNCIYNPYPAMSGPYYDCFGNHLNIVDSCGMLNFGVGVNGTLPGLVTSLIFSPGIRPIPPRPISCQDLNKTFYVPSKPISTLDMHFYYCGYPHWLAKVICFDSSKPEPPRNLTWPDFQKTLYDEMRPDVLDVGGNPCGKHKSHSDGARPIIAYSNSNDTVENLPEAFPRARRYFPFFHPELLGPTYLNKPSVFACGGGYYQISLTYDDCGGLDFRRTSVTTNFNFSGTLFKCFTVGITCTQANCEEWTKWFNANKPVLI